MSIQHTVALKLGSTGQVIDVWDGYRCTLDMLNPGEPWTFNFWHSEDSHSTWEYLLDNVKLFDSIQLTIDDAIQLNGPIEITDVRDSENGGAQFIVSGRSMVADAIDWDADPAISLRDTSLEEVLHALFDPIIGASNLIIGADATEARQVQQSLRRAARNTTTHRRTNAIDRFHPKPGEKRMALAQQAARKLGYLLWVAPNSDGQLALILDAPVSTGEPTYQFRRVADSTWNYSGDILHGGRALNGRAIPTTVHMMAHAARGDGTPARYLVTVGNSINMDPRLYRVPAHDVYRVAQRARTSAGAGQEAQRIIADANASFETYEYTVQGHGQDVNGTMTLYAVNTIAHVRDDLTRTNKDMLITRVDFIGSREHGELTTLRMVPLGALQIVPEAA